MIRDDVCCCPYCNKKAVELEEYEEDAVMFNADGKEETGVWAAGKCAACGQHVEYDYDPIGIIEYRDGRSIYPSEMKGR